MCSDWTYQIRHYKSKLDQETNLWDETKLTEVKAIGMVFYRNIWNSFDAVFAFSDINLTVTWSEGRDRKPGDWQNVNQVRNSFS